MDYQQNGSIHILHVDDEPDFADTVKIFLHKEHEQFEIETTTSASEALKRLADSSFDCIVSDYDMPEQNGIEFLKQVRMEYPDLPFILFTGKGSEEIASEAISAGVTDYLQKKTGTDQYAVLANRITNAVGHYYSQQALTERNQELKQYERMINSMGEAACIYDSEGRFEVVNEYLANWYGAERDELEGIQSSLIPHIRGQTNEDPYQELLDGTRDKLSGELEADFPNHGHAILEYHLTPLTIDGSIEAVVGIARDITEQKQREEELERAQDFLRESERLARIGAWEYDETKQVVWTEGTQRIYEVDDDYEPTVGGDLDFFHPEDRPEMERAVEAALTHGESYELQARLTTAKGNKRWVQLRGKPLNDGEAVRGYIQDITEQKRQERNLEKYKQLVDTLPDPVAVYDPDGHYELINQAGAENHETTPAELVGELSPHFQRIRDGHESDLVQALLDGDREVIKGEYTTEFASVGQRTFEYLLKVLDMDDDDGILASFRDVTERKERERQLQRERDRLDEFASIVAHDLQSPLSVADGRVELARGDCDSEHLNAIETALNRMDQIIDGMLTLAREGHDIDSLETVAIGDAVSSMWELVAEGAEHATIGYADEGVAAERITADYNRLQQLFENLFRNAVEHGGTDVTVTVGRLTDGFYVEDDGPGIPVDSRDEVSDVGYSTSEGGTGFGLSIVNQIVEAHGWDIRVTESSKGGARFEITGVEFITE